MYFALNSNNERVHIENVSAGEEYFCPSCGAKLALKKGSIRSHHFSHTAKHHCTDDWTYDMSYWHFKWQNRFPKEYQEVVVKHGGKTHRADILIEEKKIVIEFQHSPLSVEEFEARNSFYKKLGYKVYWLFDLTDLFESGTLSETSRPNIYKWVRPRATFDWLDLKNDGISLYFQFTNHAEDNLHLQDIKKRMDLDYYITSENREYYENYKDEIGCIAHVNWVSDNGIKWFAANNYYSVEEFLALFIEVNREVNRVDLYDELVLIHRKDHTQYYFGCPISETGMSASSRIDLRDSEFVQITPCPGCPYSDVYGEPRCYQRIKTSQMPEKAEIIEFSRVNGFLNKVSYKLNGELLDIYFDSPDYSKAGKSIVDLWKEYTPNKATFKNLKTGKYVRISRDPIKQINRYGNCKGGISDDRYRFPGPLLNIYPIYNPEWVIIWYA